MSSRIVVLTGERGVGKSTVCGKVIDQAKGRGYTCGGVLTLTRPDGGRDVVDVHRSRVRPLTVAPGSAQSVVVGRFHFDRATLAWGKGALHRARGCDLLIVDELGPLEIERGKGWQNAFDVLREGEFTLAIVVVRPELLARAQLQLPVSATTVFTVTHQNRDGLPDVLLKILETEAG